jgi:hypothetical protein
MTATKIGGRGTRRDIAHLWGALLTTLILALSLACSSGIDTAAATKPG